MDTSLLLMSFYGLLVCAALLMGYWFLRMVMSRRDILSENLEVNKTQAKIINDARTVASKIIEQSQNQAVEIEKLRKSLLDNYEVKVSQILSEILQNESDNLEKQMDPVREKLLTIVEDAGGQVKVQFKDLVDNYGREIQTTTETLVSELRLHYESAKEKIDKDMAVYRSNLTKDIEKSVSNSVKDLSVKIFAQSLSNENHEELVRKAIETAKKDGLFN